MRRSTTLGTAVLKTGARCPGSLFTSDSGGVQKPITGPSASLQTNNSAHALLQPLFKKCRPSLKPFAKRVILFLSLSAFLLGTLLSLGFIRPSFEISLFDGDSEYIFETTAHTVGEFLARNEIPLSADDLVEPAHETPLQNGSAIYLKRAFTVRVVSKDTVAWLSFAEGNVAQALDAAGVEYQSGDILSHALNEPLSAGMSISHGELEVAYETHTAQIEYEREQKKDSTLYEGESKVAKKGKAGVQELGVRVEYINGKESSREVVTQRTIKSPVNEVILIGTKKKEETSSNSSPKSSSGSKPSSSTIARLLSSVPSGKSKPSSSDVAKVLSVEATAYTHTGRRTSTGVWPQIGIIAVNPSQIAYGTLLYVEGYGYGVAADTGAFRKESKLRVDLFMNTKKECINYGRRRNVKVYVLK